MKKCFMEAFEHVEAIEHLIDIPRPDMLLRFAKQRAAIFGAFWSSHDILVRKTMILQPSLRMNTIFSWYLEGRNALKTRGAPSRT
jgi:hypothetical protein